MGHYDLSQLNKLSAAQQDDSRPSIRSQAMNRQPSNVVQMYLTVTDEKKISDAIHQFLALEISPC
jgi:hypothetical protein